MPRAGYEPADDLVIASAPLGAPAAREEPTDARPAPGDARRIGPCEIIAELGRGGMGVVYLCRRGGEAGFERLVAVKHLHAHLAGDAEFVAMLLDEARIAAKIRHHHVASVLDVGRFEHGYYLVMPYVEGCTFGQLLARNRTRRPPELVVPILVDALEGLHAGHALGDPDPANEVVHRDVSPNNILVGVDGNALITDFGVARARARIATTRPGIVKGTLAYTAPEVLRGELVDRRADVFAAGAMAWTALTGRALFRGDTDAETIARVLSLDVPPPSDVGLMPPRVFDPIVNKALARDPADRFATAEEMAAALRSAARSADLLGTPSEIARWVRSSFAVELDAREAAIAAADARRDLASVAVLPPLVASNELTSDRIAARARATTRDLLRFAAALLAAFTTGLFVTFYLRGCP